MAYIWAFARNIPKCYSRGMETVIDRRRMKICDKCGRETPHCRGGKNHPPDITDCLECSKDASDSRMLFCRTCAGDGGDYAATAIV